MENPNPQAQNNQPSVTKKKKTRIVFWVIMAIIFIIVLVAIYFWNKPSGWVCGRFGSCPKLWCKEVPCKQYEEFPDGSATIGECMQSTYCVPR